MQNIEAQVNALLRPEVLALSAYHVQNAKGLIKLDAMENPYTWPKEMVDEWLEVLRNAEVNRYPDPSADRLRAALRAANGIPEAAEVMLGNGSDELIQIILMGLRGDNPVVLAPQPTFVMYRQIAVSLGLQFVGVDLIEDDFSLDMPAMRDAIIQHQPKANEIGLARENLHWQACKLCHHQLTVTANPPYLSIQNGLFQQSEFCRMLRQHINVVGQPEFVQLANPCRMPDQKPQPQPCQA